MRFDLSEIYKIANAIEAESDGTFNRSLGANIKTITESSEVDDLSGYIQKYANNDELVPYLKIIRDNLATGKKDMKTGETIQRAIGGAVRYGKVPDDVRDILKQIELQEVKNMQGYTKNSEHFRPSPESENKTPILVSEKPPEVDRSKIKFNSNQTMDEFNDEFPMDKYIPMEDQPKEDDSEVEEDVRSYFRGV